LVFELAQGALHSVARHFVGAFHGVAGARAFGRHLAENGVRPGAGVKYRAMRLRWSGIARRRRSPRNSEIAKDLQG
jgi:hypothetical protein